MTDAPLPDDPALADGLTAALPELHAMRRRGIVELAAAAVVLVAVCIFVVGIDPPMVFPAAVLGVLALFWLRHRVRRSVETAAMPLIAGIVGLTHRKGGSGQPVGLLPQGATKVDDVLCGTVAGRSMEFAEIDVETGGKGSRTLFAGVVVGVDLHIPVPRFTLAAPEDTRTNFLGFARIPTTGMRLGPHIKGRDLWLGPAPHPDPAAFFHLVERLDEAAAAGRRGMRLRFATNSGRWLWLALEHDGDLFRIGDPLRSGAQMDADLQQALQDVLVPLRIAARLVELEAEAMAATAPKPPASRGP